MKRITVLLTVVIGLMLLFGSISIVGAEDLPTVGDEPPAATVEAAATLAVVALDGSTPTGNVTMPASMLNGALSNPERAFWVFVVVVLVIVIVLMAVHYNAQVRDMVSPQTARAMYNDTAVFLTGLTRSIPGQGDDLVKNFVLGVVDDKIKQWEASRSPASTTTINVNPTAPVPDSGSTNPGLLDSLQQAPG